MKIVNHTRGSLSDERIRYLFNRGTRYRENEVKECRAYWDCGLVIEFETYENNAPHRLFYTRNEALGRI